MTDTGEDREQALRPEERLATRVRELRRRRGLSQEELAARMTALGLSMHQTTVAKLEKGDRPVRVDEAVALARLLGVRLTDLLRGDEGAPVAGSHEHLTDERGRLQAEYDRARSRLDAAQREWEEARVAAQVADEDFYVAGLRLDAVEQEVADAEYALEQVGAAREPRDDDGD